MARFMLSIPTAKLQQFQDQVKAHDLRFERNPMVFGEHASVYISAEHVPPERANEFWSDWNRVKTEDAL